MIGMKNKGILLTKTIPDPALHGDRSEFRAPEILFITSYPPRECGIATYSHDLVKALNKKFNQSFTISMCPLESENEKHNYTAGWAGN